MKFIQFLKKNKFASILAAIALVFVVMFVSFLSSPLSEREVPSAFNDARISASGEAEQIVSMLAETTRRISDVKNLIGQKKHAQALTIVMEETDKNADIREKAIQLALDLEKMARAIPDIKSEEAAQSALVAASKETALIGKLLSYTNELNNLLVGLHLVVSATYPDYSQVNESIAIINGAADEINILNAEYKQEMERFDGIVNQKGERN